MKLHRKKKNTSLTKSICWLYSSVSSLSLIVFGRRLLSVHIMICFTGRRRESKFFGQARNKLENLRTTGNLDGKWARGRPREKYLDILAAWPGLRLLIVWDDKPWLLMLYQCGTWWWWHWDLCHHLPLHLPSFFFFCVFPSSSSNASLSTFEVTFGALH